MDLLKGVPAGKSAAQSTSLKDEVSFEKSFEDQFNGLQAKSKQSADSLDRQGLIDSKSSSDSRQTSRVEKPETKGERPAGNKDVESARKAKPSKQRDLRESEVEDSEASVKSAHKNSTSSDSQGVSEEERAENEVQVDALTVETAADEAADASLLVALPVSKVIVDHHETLESGVGAGSHGINPDSMNSGITKKSDGKDAGVEIPSEMTELVDQTLNVSADEQEVVPSEARMELKDAQPAEKAQSIKDFAAELWIHRNVDAESRLNGKSDLSVAFNQDSGPQKPLSIRDLDPLVSKLVTTKTGGEMNLQLRPAHLGMVKVEILTEGDAVKVNLFAEKASAQSALSSQVNELKQQLHAVGLKVETVTVNTLQSNSSEQSRDGQNQQQARHQQENPQQRPQQQAAQREFDLDAWGEEAA
jgi:flagellar hook-length control protein FliK